MVMDQPESVEQFHAGGASVGGMLAVYDLSARALSCLVPEGGRLLDLGVGSGRALQRFLAMRPDVTATAVDLAPNMLATARRFLDADGAGQRVSLVEADMTALAEELAAAKWDAVSCVWSLHHLPDRETLRAALRQIAEIRDRHGSAVWLLDFQRLRRPETMPDIIAALQPETPRVLHADGVASEAAAFTHDELRTALAAGLGDLKAGLARPIPWLQAFWCNGRAKGRPVSSSGRPEPLRGTARVDATLLRLGFSRRPR
jgi:SAM-dependent methyltransferase